MSERPNIYLDNPDPLSVLLSHLELSAEVYVSGDFCGTWAVDTAGSRRIPFHLIGDGEAWLHFEGREPEHLGAKDLVVFPQDSHHIIANSSQKPNSDRVNTPMSNEGDITKMVCGFFEFKNPSIFPLLDALSDVVLLRVGPGDTSSGALFFIDRILAELQSLQPGIYTAINQIAFLIFIEIIRQQVASGAIKDGLLNALFDSRIGKALNAIHQRADYQWTVESLAEQAAMSRSSFSSHFNKRVGVTPMKYLATWRMTEARRLLVSTQLSMAQIAEQSGYDSEVAFRKAFKNVLGETPGAVRAAAKGDSSAA